MSITASPCPRRYLDVITAANLKTSEEHRSRQPYAFPENLWEVSFPPEFSNAFLDAKGEPTSESHNLFVAEDAGELAGYILLSWWARDDAPDFHDGCVLDIHVFDGFRGKKVGDALLNKAKLIADTRGWDNFTAQVWAGNTQSETLFRRAGFTDQSKTLRYGPNTQARPIQTVHPKRGTQFPVAKIWAAILITAVVWTLLRR